MRNKYFFGMALLLTFLCSCALFPDDKEKQDIHESKNEVDVIKISHSTWDRETSVIIGYDSDMAQQKIVTQFDSIFSVKKIVSIEALKYMGDFIYKNLKDSVRGNLDGRQYVLDIVLYNKSDSIAFYMQPKTDNNFLERLRDTMKKSKYEKEYVSLDSILVRYEEINRRCK